MTVPGLCEQGLDALRRFGELVATFGEFGEGAARVFGVGDEPVLHLPLTFEREYMSTMSMTVWGERIWP